MVECWANVPDQRPSFLAAIHRLTVLTVRLFLPASPSWYRTCLPRACLLAACFPCADRVCAWATWARSIPPRFPRPLFSSWLFLTAQVVFGDTLPVSGAPEWLKYVRAQYRFALAPSPPRRLCLFPTAARPWR